MLAFRSSFNDAMISVNAAIQVDLYGQVNAEMIGGVQYSGSGGQFDFVTGAAKSRGGKSFVVLPATAKSGAVSTIVPRGRHRHRRAYGCRACRH